MKTNHLKAASSFLYSVVAALLIGAVATLFFNVEPIIPAGIVMAVGVVHGVINHYAPMQKGFAFMAIQQEFWVNYIIENLFKDNSFTSKCFDESDSVLAGSVVHIPQGGAKPTVVKNRSSFPATVVQRTDTDITYTLDVYSTDPTLITDAEAKEISYNKIDSVLSEHMESLVESYSDQLLYKWAPTDSAQIVVTTGDLVATALTAGATGTRRKFLKADLKAAQKIMNKQNIPKEDRYAIFPSDVYAQLTDDTDLIARDGVNGNELDLKKGVVLKLYGFNIMERSDTTPYTTGNVPKAPGAATAVTDHYAVICWHKNAVAKALGSTKFFETIGDATMYGDVYSAEVKMGGRKRRTAGAGVVAIVQVAS